MNHPKIEGNIGYWELEDMVAARDWLVREKIAHPEQIILYGGSYGAFLTCWGLGKRPDLWASGLAVVALVDWTVMYEDSSDAMKGFCRVLFGGSPEEVPERYIASSPITFAENVAAPLLVLQGRHDSRTPARQLEMYETKMKELGKEIEVIWFDSGHGTTSVEQYIEFQETMIRFAQRILAKGGS